MNEGPVATACESATHRPVQLLATHSQSGGPRFRPMLHGVGMSCGVEQDFSPAVKLLEKSAFSR